jgi:hypothetical protein
LIVAARSATRRSAGRPLTQLGLDRVRRRLPDAVEPVNEHGQLGAPRLVGGVQPRLGVATLEVADDLDRVDDDGAAVVDDRNEPLARGRA